MNLNPGSNVRRKCSTQPIPLHDAVTLLSISDRGCWDGELNLKNTYWYWRREGNPEQKESERKS